MARAAKLEAFLRQVSNALDRAGISYMLTGSLASSMYGLPRATNDLDFVIAPIREELHILARIFADAHLYFPRERIDSAFENQTDLNVIDFASGWKADLILRKNREFSITEFRRREEATVEGIRLHVATPEDVVISKLEWWTISPSDRQMDDIVGILRVQRDNLDLSYITQWINSLSLHDAWSEAQRRAV